MAAITIYKLIDIPIFEATLTPTYKDFIYHKINEEAHTLSIYNPFFDEVKAKKDAKLAKTMKAENDNYHPKTRALEQDSNPDPVALRSASPKG
ncbi:hypothetical protein DSO57_1004149 [Entomophthora muscae]|uniref:Uncharacterized protein n=1 Tax=Entomophthora muscae TaxID=34485 RepID=A0ACC2UIV4_9FUNG|nr:hypothetical protein DSO57_1004149 [Entomophthora muscae]